LVGLATTGTHVVPDSVVLTVAKESFNHKVDEVADELSLQLTVTAKGLTYSRSDIDFLIGSQLNPQIPEGYSAVGDYQITIIPTDASGTKTDLTLTASVPLKPNYDQQVILSEVTGRSISQAQDYLKQLPSVVRVNLTVAPPLPGPLLTLPHLANRIVVEFVPSEP
jgi:hypothetical protein